jgi:hypothetical protein
MSSKKVLTITLSVNLVVIFILFALFGSGALRLPVASAQEGSAEEAALFDFTVPYQMNYQGFLTDAHGIPVNGNHNLTFTIYQRRSSGLPPTYSYVNVWSETQNSVSVSKGLFSVVLGSVTPLDPTDFGGVGGLFTTGQLQLGVKVDGGTEISPRTSLVTVPYAFRSETTNSFPTPDYDSGWQAINPAQSLILTHNLGGNPDNYFVYLTFKAADGDIHQMLYGGMYDEADRHRGAHWSDLNASSIRIYRLPDDSDIPQVRVQIWVMK